MSPNIKRAFLIIGFLGIAALIGFGLYYMFLRSAPVKRQSGVEAPAGGTLPGSQERGATTTGGGTTPGEGSLPTAGIIPRPDNQNFFVPEPVTQITRDYALYPSLNQNGGFRYHNGSDGKFYHTNADGSLSALSDEVFFNVENVVWARNTDKAVIEYPDGNKIVYDFDKEKQVTLPQHWDDFSFSPDGDQLAAKSLGLSPESRWLITTNADGTGTKLLEHIGNNANKVIVDWSPSRQTVALSQTGAPQGADRREIILHGANNENFKSLIVEGLGFNPQWSPTGNKLLYSVDSARSDFKPELWIVNSYGEGIGNSRQSLLVNTWADKCTFGDDNTLFCAIPRDLPVGAGMAREIANDSFDDLYKIDLQTGQKTPIELGKSFTIDNISYDKTRNKVMFTDNRQSGAFEVNL